MSRWCSIAQKPEGCPLRRHSRVACSSQGEVLLLEFLTISAPQSPLIAQLLQALPDPPSHIHWNQYTIETAKERGYRGRVGDIESPASGLDGQTRRRALQQHWPQSQLRGRLVPEGPNSDKLSDSTRRKGQR